MGDPPGDGGAGRGVRHEQHRGGVCGAPGVWVPEYGPGGGAAVCDALGVHAHAAVVCDEGGVPRGVRHVGAGLSRVSGVLSRGGVDGAGVEGGEEGGGGEVGGGGGGGAGVGGRKRGEPKRVGGTGGEHVAVGVGLCGRPGRVPDDGVGCFSEYCGCHGCALVGSQVVAPVDVSNSCPLERLYGPLWVSYNKRDDFC